MKKIETAFVGNRLIMVILLALAIRVVMLIVLGPTLHVDWGQMENLENMLSGNGLSNTVMGGGGTVTYAPTARDLPLHGLLIAGTWLLSGTRSLIFIQLLQVLLDSLMVALVYLTGRELFGERVGILASVLFALYLPEAWLSIVPRRDVWVSFATIVSFFFCVRYLREQRLRMILYAGVVLGLGVYFRSTLLLFPLALGVAMLLFIEWKKALLASFVMTAIIIAFLVPWAARNYNVLGRFILTEVNFNQSMWEGFGEFPNPVGAVNNDEATFKQMRKEGFKGRPASLEYEDYLAPKVHKVLREHTLWYLGIVLRRIPRALLINRVPWGVLQARPDEVGFHKIYADRNHEKSVLEYAKYMMVVNPGFLITKVFDTAILFLAAAGFVISLKDGLRRRNALLLAALPFYFIMILIPIRMEGRYIVPVHWTYLIFMSVTLVYLKDKVSEYRRKR